MAIDTGHTLLGANLITGFISTVVLRNNPQHLISSLVMLCQPPFRDNTTTDFRAIWIRSIIFTHKGWVIFLAITGMTLCTRYRFTVSHIIG